MLPRPWVCGGIRLCRIGPGTRPAPEAPAPAPDAPTPSPAPAGDTTGARGVGHPAGYGRRPRALRAVRFPANPGRAGPSASAGPYGPPYWCRHWRRSRRHSPASRGFLSLSRWGRRGGREHTGPLGRTQILGVQVQQANAGYSYPEIPQQVEQGIPNYYAESRQLRGLSAIPEDAGNFARQIGRYIYDSLPSDPDRGGTVEETIANILDYAANRAHAAQDQLNADFLAKIAGKWRQVISKKSPAINPDAPIERNDNQGETGYLGALPAPLSSPFWLSAAAGVAAGILGSRKSKAKSRDFLAYGVGGGLTAYLVLLAIQASGDTDK